MLDDLGGFGQCCQLANIEVFVQVEAEKVGRISVFNGLFQEVAQAVHAALELDLRKEPGPQRRRDKPYCLMICKRGLAVEMKKRRELDALFQ